MLPDIELKEYRFCTGFGYGMHQRPAVFRFFINNALASASDTQQESDPNRNAINLVTSLLNQARKLQSDLKLPVFGEPRLVQLLKGDQSIIIVAAMPYHKAPPLLRAIHALLQQANAGKPPEEWADSVDLALFSEQIKSHTQIGTNLRHILRALYEMNAECRAINRQIYQLGFGPQAPRFISAHTDQTPAIAFNTACCKSEAHELFSASGLPVARSIVVTTREMAEEAAGKIGGRVVVKPESSDGGHGVTAGISNIEQVPAAFDSAIRHSPKVLVEEHVDGDDFRLIYFSGQLVRAFGRRKQGVTGDGQSTISELITDKNNAKANDRKKLKLDENELRHLSDAGLTPDSIPAAGQHIKLGELHNVSAGGVIYPIDVKTVHPSFVYIGQAAVNTLRLDIAGVDILAQDITLPLQEQRAVISEVNANPQFGSDDQGVFAYYAANLMKRVPHKVRRELVIAVSDSDFYIRATLQDDNHKDIAVPATVIVCQQTVNALPGFSLRHFNTTLQAAQAAHNSMESGTLRVVLTFTEVMLNALPFGLFDSISIDPEIPSVERQVLDRVLAGHSRKKGA